MSEQRPTPPLRSRGTLPTLFSVVIVDLVGFGIVIPILPFLVKDLGATALELGLVVAAYPAAQFVFSPVWGRLSDRVGRRRVMLCTVAGSAFALLWLGLAGSLVSLFCARLLSGAFAANVSVASAYISDVTEASERTRWMGMLGASFGVGFVLGPAIGGLLSAWGHHTPMLAAAALAAANWCYALFVLPEPPRHAAQAGAARRGRLDVLREPAVARLCALSLLFSLAVVQLETIFAWFMLDRFGYDARGVAWILVLMAAWMGGIQGGGMKALSARFGERTLVLAGASLLAVSMAAAPASHAVWVLLVPLLGAATGRAVMQPALMSLTSVAAPPERRGAVMGTYQSAASLGRVAGPLLAGLLYGMSMAAPFWFAGALLAAVALGARELCERADAPAAFEGGVAGSPDVPPPA